MYTYNMWIKLLGIFFIASGVSTLPSMLFLATFSPGTSMSLYFFSALTPILTIFMGFVLFSKTEYVSKQFETDDNNTNDSINFSVAIQLLGVFFVVTYLGESIGSIINHFLQSKDDSNSIFRDAIFYKNLFTTFVGLTLVVKGKSIAMHIKETTK